MPIYRCEGICLRVRKLDESDRLVNYFTDRYGKVCVKIKGIGKTTSRYGSVAEAFSQVQMDLYKPREDRPVFSLTSAHLVSSRQRLRAELTSFYAASFICELLDHCAPDEDPHQGLWRLLCEALDKLEQVNDPRFLLLSFQLKAFYFLGLGLNLHSCSGCGETLLQTPSAFSGRMAGMLCSHCCRQDSSAVAVDEDFYSLWIDAFGWTGGQENLAEVPGERWEQSLRALIPFWEYHLDFKPKSLRFIRDEIN